MDLTISPSLRVNQTENMEAFQRYDDLARAIWGKRSSKEVMDTFFRTKDVCVPDLELCESDTLPKTTFTTFCTDPAGGGHSQFLLRDVYRELALLVSSEERARSMRVLGSRQGGIAVLGSPGIGKSTFLDFLLVEYLLDAKPVLLYHQHFPNIVIAFSGPSAVAVSIDMVTALPPALATGILLMDNVPEPVPPPTALVGESSKLFIVHATSPEPVRWKEWVMVRGADTFWMEPWTWSEIYTQSCCVKSLEVDAVWEAFVRYGPIVENVFNAVRGGEDATTHLDQLLESAAKNIAALPLHAIAPIFYEQALPSVPQDQLSRIFLIRPSLQSRRKLPTMDFVSSKARDSFCVALEKAGPHKLHSFFLMITNRDHFSAGAW